MLIIVSAEKVQVCWDENCGDGATAYIFGMFKVTNFDYIAISFKFLTSKYYCSS